MATAAQSAAARANLEKYLTSSSSKLRTSSTAGKRKVLTVGHLRSRVVHPHKTGRKVTDWRKLDRANPY